MKQYSGYKHSKGHVLEVLMFNFQPLLQYISPLLPLARAMVRKNPLKGKMILYSYLAFILYHIAGPSVSIFKELFGNISDAIFPSASIQLENERLREQISFLEQVLLNTQRKIESENEQVKALQEKRQVEKEKLLKLKDYFDMEIEGILEILRFNEVFPSSQFNLDQVQSWEQKNQLRIESKITQIYHIISQYKITLDPESSSNEQLVEVLNQNFFHLKQLYTCMQSSKSLEIKQLKFSLASLQSEISLMNSAHQIEMDKLQKTLVEYEDMITRFMDADSISFATLQDLSQEKKLARSQSCPNFQTTTNPEKIDYDKRSSNYFQARNNNPKIRKQVSKIQDTLKELDDSKSRLEASFESELESLKKLLDQRQTVLVNMKLSHQIELDRVYHELSAVDQEIAYSETTHHTHLQTLSPGINTHNCISPTLTVDSLDYKY
ncbi:hypothetical protein HK103_000458 [Boothiomyces macroporosus]|uniref:Uncharacterized protein n=1 Tax=Boothiomyces macroporosus TaxID=261099 RepID=A0AAD5UF57_9FUNG|nr:hypothetical protein HK103_000458 [Boothiomyces macroporosus]